MIQSIHPFPARMAPDLALESLGDLKPCSLVLDPMSGSGTVLRHAVELGHRAKGRDLDPLAVLMARVWTRPLQRGVVEQMYVAARRRALAMDPAAALPWIDCDAEAKRFVTFWFGPQQRRDLRCWARVLFELGQEVSSVEELAALDVIKVALSRTIVTKEQCASLARDTSHSRPHKVAQSSPYQVFAGLDRSLKTVLDRLEKWPIAKFSSEVLLGDARSTGLRARSVDAVLTSPPYLNAIDYMRGHRLALVWLGYSLSELRIVRAESIGSERKNRVEIEQLCRLRASLGSLDALEARHRGMIDRYVVDVWRLMKEMSRVLKVEGRATFVVGNSCLKGVYIKNSAVVAAAGELAGLTLLQCYERDLPAANRYLPTAAGSSLSKRMRTETIIRFRRGAALQ